jgi:hypothetical protein
MDLDTKEIDGACPCGTVTVVDGVNHPSDTNAETRIAGVLRFTSDG